MQCNRLFSFAFVFGCVLLPLFAFFFFFLHTLFSLPFYDFNKNYHFYLLFLVSTAILLVSILVVFKEKKIKNEKENLM